MMMMKIKMKISLCVFASEGKVLHLEIVPLLRDVGFFVISILMFVGFLSFSNGAITQLQSGIMVSFFFVYLASMMVLSKYYGNDDEDDKQSAPQHHVLDQVHRQRTGSILSQPRTRAISKDGNARRGSIDGDAETAALVNGNKSISNGKKELNGATSNGATYGTNGHAHNHHEDGDGDADRSRSGSNGSSSSSDIYVPVIGTILHYISVPYRWLIGVVLYPFLGSEGTDNEEGIKRFWPVVLVVSIAFISLLSDVILVLTTKFADAVNLPHNVAGLTILALGAQVPDTFASIAVARGGEGPSAIANAIGSQNLDILVGIGLPFFIYSAATGQSVSISSKSMDDSGANIDQHGVTLIGIGLGILVFVFLILSLRYYIQSKMKKPRRGSVSAEIQEQEVIKPSLQVSDAIVLLSLYVILTAIVVLDQVKL